MEGLKKAILKNKQQTITDLKKIANTRNKKKHST